MTGSDPSHSTSVFVGLSFSLLADIQSLMTVTHAVSLWTASAASSIVVLMYSGTQSTQYITITQTDRQTYTYFWYKMFFLVTMSFSSCRYSTASFLTFSKSSFSRSTAFTRFNCLYAGSVIHYQCVQNTDSGFTRISTTLYVCFPRLYRTICV